MKSKCGHYMIRPHLEKNAKILKIGQVIVIFVRLTKILSIFEDVLSQTKTHCKSVFFQISGIQVFCKHPKVLVHSLQGLNACKIQNYRLERCIPFCFCFCFYSNLSLYEKSRRQRKKRGGKGKKIIQKILTTEAE